jgi:glutaredoxin 2
LRIQDGKGSDRWMPESLDIVRYLKDRAKAGKAAHS